MKQAFIHYVVHENKVGENETFIRDVFEELRHLELQKIKYMVYKMGANVFVHIACFEDEAANRLFIGLNSFKAFQRTLKSRLSEKPIINDVAEIGFYSDSRKA